VPTYDDVQRIERASGVPTIDDVPTIDAAAEVRTIDDVQRSSAQRSADDDRVPAEYLRSNGRNIAASKHAADSRSLYL